MSAEAPVVVVQAEEEEAQSRAVRSPLVSAVSMTLHIRRTIGFVQMMSGLEVAMRGPGNLQD